MDLLRAVIVGPAGTPYHDGLFFFDVYFPSQYPSKPPVRNILMPYVYMEACFPLFSIYKNMHDNRYDCSFS
jgi:ubiquitin-protein ligase